MGGAGAARPGPAQRRQPVRGAEAGRSDAACGSSARCPARCSSSTISPTQLNTAAGDSLYAQALYILLAVPGALVALGRRLPRRARHQSSATGATSPCCAPAAPGGATCWRWPPSRASRSARRRPRRGGDRLRRGAAPGQRRRAPDALGRALITAVVSVAVGDPRRRRGADRRHRVGRFAGTVAEGRRSARPASRPAWQRYYLDLLALALSGLIYWLTIRTGFSAVVNPDANPTLSLSVYMFFGPALLWIGATLLLVRLRGRGLDGWPARVRRATASSTAPRSCSPAPAAAARRSTAGWWWSGSCSPSASAWRIFSATYDQQARVDAQLTLGADVTVSAPPDVAQAATCRPRSPRYPASPRPPPSTTPTPTSVPTSRTRTGSTRRASPMPPRFGTPTSSAAPRAR